MRVLTEFWLQQLSRVVKFSQVDTLFENSMTFISLSALRWTRFWEFSLSFDFNDSREWYSSLRWTRSWKILWNLYHSLLSSRHAPESFRWDLYFSDSRESWSQVDTLSSQVDTLFENSLDIYFTLRSQGDTSL